jgi:hypothetical protein
MSGYECLAGLPPPSCRLVGLPPASPTLSPLPPPLPEHSGGLPEYSGSPSDLSCHCSRFSAFPDLGIAHLHPGCARSSSYRTLARSPPFVVRSIALPACISSPGANPRDLSFGLSGFPLITPDYRLALFLNISNSGFPLITPDYSPLSLRLTPTWTSARRLPAPPSPAPGCWTPASSCYSPYLCPDFLGLRRTYVGLLPDFRVYTCLVPSPQRGPDRRPKLSSEPTT